MIAVIVYRLAVYAAFASLMENTQTLQPISGLLTPQLATSVTASCLNFVIIMILNFLYERIAIWITDMGKQWTWRRNFQGISKGRTHLEVLCGFVLTSGTVGALRC